MAEEVVDPVPVTIVDAPVEEVPVEEFVHPGHVDGYDVLDLTVQYNQSHDPVPGFFRVTSLKDAEVTEDVVTDAPSGPEGEMSLATRAAVKAAIKRLEAARKGK